MQSKPSASKQKVAPVPSAEARQALEEQMAAFLKAGGEVQQIPRGVSGQVYGSTRQITIGKK
ncbi:hypothetical protein D9M71_288940 [compost metagenome]|uniref:Transcriptional regulator SutA RNAP-binding domain-containing protein n=2 Tax=Pseudomonadaceae TaxID=135621 RepID=A0A1I5VTS8_9GAMM|nr:MULTISPECIES: hypothetical protein [Pseudomonas]MCM2319674.1 hypothetical protein [Pseudomonas sp.]SEJ25465.1 hypothetical protein SAMN05216201_106101 [Pseudomonas linyingensis]SFQ10687.1 hypothetical protein SAMN05216229_111131 [Pseudomonas sagittaria]